MHRAASFLLGPLLPAVAVGLALRSGLAVAAEPSVVPEVAEPAIPPATADDEPAPEPAPATAAEPGERREPTWFRRYGPRRRSWELGAFVGVWAPSDRIELYDLDVEFRGYRAAAAELGLRAGYYPLRHFGLEGELAFIPAGLEAGGAALVLGARAQGVLQLGIGRVVPFVLLGGGVLTVRGDDDDVGLDADEALHVGGGVKVYVTRNLVVRLDVRDMMSPRVGVEPIAPAHQLEVLVGVSWALGPRRRRIPVEPDAPTAPAAPAASPASSVSPASASP